MAIASLPTVSTALRAAAPRTSRVRTYSLTSIGLLGAPRANCCRCPSGALTPSHRGGGCCSARYTYYGCTMAQYTNYEGLWLYS